MSNILIIRSCNMAVLHDFMEDTYCEERNDNVYCLVQENVANNLILDYPNIKFLIMQNTKFNYKKLKKNKKLFKEITNILFDEIYILSSTEKFFNYDEIFMITSKCNSSKYILYNCNREKYMVNLNFYLIRCKSIVKNISYIIQIPIAISIILLVYAIMYPYTYIKNSI
ncbi:MULTISPECIES: hypothetical protein [unclassified Clostridium]|uniref:hypothetical protein n=1 Tax=unclassified Clostridium TaxID=2614128 RepID=UPI0013FA8701|nr:MULTISPECIES: hypothetical protein [unclassified Clostridium]NFR87443.1 hypothetical protein [Clostridium botulinum]NFR89389.1 hypothetical protein [Clostridium botulinum]NFT98972.1 hypothetical protein [Clostridium botulinum]